MNYIFLDTDVRDHLLPLTFTRPVVDLRVGILTIKEKWQKRLEGDFSYSTQDYLSSKYLLKTDSENVLLNGSICPNEDLVAAINSLNKGEQLVAEGLVIAQRVGSFANQFEEGLKSIDFKGTTNQIDRPWKIFSLNGAELEEDFELLTKGRDSQPISATNTVLGDRVFAERGAKVECSILNSTTGPIYLGYDSEVMEGSVVRGGLALCDHASLKLSTKIYGPTTVGPHSKVGGEVNNSVITGYSNKGHDGFLGNSVLGEWCNIGADSNNSNLKNNYDEVKLWSYTKGGFEKTGLQFCGLIMGDHSKCGINTMFNTGTVVGVSANIFGSGFPRNYVPSFSWGGASGFTEYKLDKALKTAELVMQRRSIELDDTEKGILENIYNMTASRR